MSKPKRGRPYGFPSLSEIAVGESIVVTPENIKKAATTARNLKRKRGMAFEVTNSVSNLGWLSYRRAA